ncbi:neuropeptide Y receptor type 1-like [Ylistrum balloti]|uniref:neuropeptide Y receptor type 1-like n=1 Tax=Ylistrum balloti TaxID=509963 RepID=UPI002905ADF2|nr:neuropeptide Y receptor type 1-like [Ylistrum balloti]
MDNLTFNEGILDQLNSRLARDFLPNTVILFAYIVLGLLGNVAVIYIYKFRFQKSPEDRLFIPYLAGIDTLACVICSSANLIINFNPVRYPGVILCKTFFMLSQFAAASSALMLTIIAIERFQLICRPFKPKMTLRKKRMSVLLMLMFMFLGSIPSLFTTGIVPITNTHLNVTGYVCASVKVMGSKVFPFVYNLLVLVICAGNLIILCTLYFMIGKTIYSRVKSRASMQKPAVCVSSSSDGLDEENPSTFTETKLSSSQPHGKTSRKMKTAGNRISIMFLVISLVYVLCFVPTLIAIVKSPLDRNDWEEKSTVERLGLRTANAWYIINNIVNPVIYGFFDKSLRREIASWSYSIC